jgi:NAD(P)-dependent dehydrogenase (short-subunit alcohol dehydrogenase family)
MIKADSADPEAVKDAVAQTVARFGRLAPSRSIVENNARCSG